MVSLASVGRAAVVGRFSAFAARSSRRLSRRWRYFVPDSDGGGQATQEEQSRCDPEGGIEALPEKSGADDETCEGNTNEAGYAGHCVVDGRSYACLLRWHRTENGCGEWCNQVARPTPNTTWPGKTCVQ